MLIGKNREKKIMDRVICYVIGIGLVIFGGWAIFYRTYHSIIYGDIDLGKYHYVIGIASIFLGAIYMLYITFKDIDVKQK